MARKLEANRPVELVEAWLIESYGFWVAVKELKLSYNDPETTFFTI